MSADARDADSRRLGDGPTGGRYDRRDGGTAQHPDHYHPDPDDPASGLAPERTELAWDRSGLAVVVCAAILGRRLWPFDSSIKLLAGAAISVGVALWLLVLVFTNHHVDAAPADTGRGIRRMTAATVAFAAGAFLLSLLPPAPA